MNILDETRQMISAARNVGKDVEKITLSLSRLSEFLLAAISNRCMTTSEIEQIRKSCLRGEAAVWGVPIEFTDESSN